MRSSKPKNKKLKVVLDSTIWISGLIFGGIPEQIIKLFINSDITIVISEEIISEIRRKVHKKFPLFAHQLHLLDATLHKDALITELGLLSINICRDPDDTIILETALSEKCNFIISGDKDLLSLKEYCDIKIISARDFIMKYSKSDNMNARL